MAKIKMKSMIIPFKELLKDEEGNVVLDKKTEQPVYKTVNRVVRLNSGYFPKH